MKPETQRLHYALIRHVRGLLNAWDEWVRAQEPDRGAAVPDKVIENPDPLKIFSTKRD